MDARYTIRNNQWLDECQVAPAIFEPVMPRLHTFLAPFVDTCQGQAFSHHATTSVSGLLSDVARQNVASIAYHVGQNRLGLQGFIGGADGADAHMYQAKLLGLPAAPPPESRVPWGSHILPVNDDRRQASIEQTFDALWSCPSEDMDVQ